MYVCMPLYALICVCCYICVLRTCTFHQCLPSANIVAVLFVVAPLLFSPIVVIARLPFHCLPVQCLRFFCYFTSLTLLKPAAVFSDFCRYPSALNFFVIWLNIFLFICTYSHLCTFFSFFRVSKSSFIFFPNFALALLDLFAFFRSLLKCNYFLIVIKAPRSIHTYKQSEVEISIILSICISFGVLCTLCRGSPLLIIVSAHIELCERVPLFNRNARRVGNVWKILFEILKKSRRKMPKTASGNKFMVSSDSVTRLIA